MDFAYLPVLHLLLTKNTNPQVSWQKAESLLICICQMVA